MDSRILESRHQTATGARDANVVEHGGRISVDLRLNKGPSVKISYSVQWKRSVLDVAELAQKRFIEGWTINELSQHFGRTENAIQCAYYDIKRRKFQHPKISEKLRKKILEALL